MSFLRKMAREAERRAKPHNILDVLLYLNREKRLERMQAERKAAA